MNESRSPLYQTIIQDVKDKIARGEYKPNDYLGTQIDLARAYGTSEITSRRALAELTDQGYVYRIKGKGTFISEGINHEGTTIIKPQEINHIYIVTNFMQPVGAEKQQQFYPLNHVLDNRFFIDTIGSIGKECRKLGIPTSEISNYNSGLPDRPDAGFLFFLPQDNHANYMHLFDEKRSFVTVHGYFPHLSIPYVIGDNLTGGYLATHHLINEGHTDIAIVLTGESMALVNQEFSLRYQGYKLAMDQHRLPIRPEYIIMDPREDENAGFTAMEKLLKLRNPPTAVFFSTDMKALGGMYSLRMRNIDVPGEMSIIGYDDQYFSEALTPSLTTVNQNADRIGQRAVQLLLERVRTKSFAKDEIVPTIVIRDTVAPPPQKK